MICPKCGQQELQFAVKPTGGVGIQCQSCHAWFDVQLIPPFTGDPPTQPGPWWYRDTIDDDPIILNLWLNRTVLRVEDEGGDFYGMDVRKLHGQWSGPLVPPE